MRLGCAERGHVTQRSLRGEERCERRCSRWRERRRLKRIAEMSSSAADFTSDFSPLDDDGQKWLEMM